MLRLWNGFVVDHLIVYSAPSNNCHVAVQDIHGLQPAKLCFPFWVYSHRLALPSRLQFNSGGLMPGLTR